MSTILRTERLSLDANHHTDDVHVGKFIGGVKEEPDIRREMPLWTKRGGDGCIGIWCISNRMTGEKVGSGFLLPIPIHKDDTNWDHVVPGVMPDGDVEIGYILKEAAWGKGYATEVCRRLLRFAFEESPLEEIVATLDDAHEASKRVLEKAGFPYRGRRKAYGEDSPDWRISRSQWLARGAE